MPFLMLGRWLLAEAEANVTLLEIAPADVAAPPAKPTAGCCPLVLPLLRLASRAAPSGVLMRGRVRPPPAEPPAATPSAPACTADAACAVPALSVAAVPTRLAVVVAVDGLLVHPPSVLNPLGLLREKAPSVRPASEASGPRPPPDSIKPGDCSVGRRGGPPVAAASVAALPHALVVLARSPVVKRRGCSNGCGSSRPGGERDQQGAGQHTAHTR